MKCEACGSRARVVESRRKQDRGCKHNGHIVALADAEVLGYQGDYRVRVYSCECGHETVTLERWLG